MAEVKSSTWKEQPVPAPRRRVHDEPKEASSSNKRVEGDSESSKRPPAPQAIPRRVHSEELEASDDASHTGDGDNSKGSDDTERDDTEDDVAPESNRPDLFHSSEKVSVVLHPSHT